MQHEKVMAVSTAWRPRGAALLAVAATLLAFALPGARTGLQYDRLLVGQGEWWRFLTGHWVHWTANHLLWDLLTFAALGACALRIARLRALGTVLSASIAIPAALWFLQPELTHYRGLSGLASALYVFVILVLAKRSGADGESRRAFALWGLLGAFVAKILYEVATGHTVFVQSMGANVRAVPLAHLVGGVLGALFAAAGSGCRTACHTMPAATSPPALPLPRSTCPLGKHTGNVYRQSPSGCLRQPVNRTASYTATTTLDIRP